MAISRETRRVSVPFAAFPLSFTLLESGPFMAGKDQTMLLVPSTNIQENALLSVAMFPAGTRGYSTRMDRSYQFGANAGEVLEHRFSAPPTPGDYDIVVMIGYDLNDVIWRQTVTYAVNVVPAWLGPRTGEASTRLPIHISGVTDSYARLVLSKDGEEWALVQGFPFEPSTHKATGVILEPGQPPRLTYDSLENLDRRFGGDGAVDLTDQVIDLNDPNGDLEVDPPSEIPLGDIPDGVPMDRIDRDATTYIALRDGLWKSAMDFNFDVGCPPGISPAVRAMVGNGATTQAQFSTPYHPTDFSDQLAFAPWKRVSANGFVAGPFAPAGAEGMPPGMSFSILYIMATVSPEQVDVWAQVILNLPPMMAAMVGGTGSCLVEGNGTYTYLGE